MWQPFEPDREEARHLNLNPNPPPFLDHLLRHHKTEQTAREISNAVGHVHPSPGGFQFMFPRNSQISKRSQYGFLDLTSETDFWSVYNDFLVPDVQREQREYFAAKRKIYCDKVVRRVPGMVFVVSICAIWLYAQYFTRQQITNSVQIFDSTTLPIILNLTDICTTDSFIEVPRTKNTTSALVISCHAADGIVKTERPMHQGKHQGKITVNLGRNWNTNDNNDIGLAIVTYESKINSNCTMQYLYKMRIPQVPGKYIESIHIPSVHPDFFQQQQQQTVQFVLKSITVF
jgi:hypothetical protein